MVNVSQLYRFSVQYSEASGLNRILDALFRAGAEPSWLFARLRGDKRFRLQVNVAGLAPAKADVLVARLRGIPTVRSVKIEQLTPDARPVAERLSERATVLPAFEPEACR